MRKIDPKSVKADFVAALNEINSSLAEVKVASLSDATKKLVAGSSLLSAAVLWEGFVTDLFVAYINKDASRLSSNFQARIVESAKSKFGDLVSKGVKLTLPKHLPEKSVRTILDPKEYNLSFETAADMQNRAADYLVKTAASAFKSLTVRDLAAVDGWHSIRNFLAHRSQSSEDRMNDALKVAAVPPELRRNQHKVKDAGDFLKSVPVGTTKKWRVERYLVEMQAIAQKL